MVVEYIEDMGHRLHPAFPGGLVYDFGTASWKRPELSSNMYVNLWCLTTKVFFSN